MSPETDCPPLRVEQPRPVTVALNSETMPGAAFLNYGSRGQRPGAGSPVNASVGLILAESEHILRNVGTPYRPIAAQWCTPRLRMGVLR